MDLEQQSNYILEHPYFRKAINEYYLGNNKMILDVLNRVQKCCIDTQVTNSVRCFSLNKRCASNEIKDFLSDIEPPDNLSIYLPIVHEKVEPNKVLYESEIKKDAIKKNNAKVLKIERPKIVDEIKIIATIKHKSGEYDYCTIRKTTLGKDIHLMLYNGTRVLRFKFNTNKVTSSTAYVKANTDWVTGFIGFEKPKNKCFIKLKSA